MTAPVVVPHRIEVNGQVIRFRWEQMLAWSVAAGFAGACFIAGLYFLWLQLKWHVHWGAFNHGSSLKLWWDNLFSFKSWALYRHGLRDLGEPAAATAGVRTLLAKPKWWTVRLKAWQLAAVLLLLAVTAVALITGGTWLINFGLPAAWHALGWHRVTGPDWIAHSSWENLALGLLVIGPVLHWIWAPAGATLQGYRIDAAVGRALAARRTPLWVNWPAVPPVVRERFAWDLASRQRSQRGSIVHPAQLHEQLGRGTRIFMAVLVAVGVLVTLTGIIAKFWISAHHGFWYLTA